MQVKIVVGTISFMLTMMILGFAALREPARLEEFSHAFEGRTIEAGAKIFQGNCSTCHGVSGKAEECYNTSGESIACRGIPLNRAALLCGDRSQRMVALGWEGSKQSFVQNAIAAGRIGTAMPTWSADFGGPMRQDQIENVAAYVLNFESEEMCSGTVVTFEWPDTVEDFLAQFPDGDPANGEAVFQIPYGCSGCHGNPDVPGSAAVGPNLGQINQDGATRKEGYTAADYVYESILDPDAFIAPDCPTGPCTSPSLMASAGLADRLATNPQDLADILAYLLQDRNQ